MRPGGVPTFAALAKTTSTEFYADETGTNYAEARYLMYYLQEHDLLQSFYRAVRADRAKDPTGYATLVHVLGDRDMVAFQHEWEAWVKTLRFP